MNPNDIHSPLKAMLENQDKLNSISGFSSIISLAESIQKSTLPTNIKWLGGITDMVNSISNQMKPLDVAGAVMGGTTLNIASQILENQKGYDYVSLTNLASPLSRIQMYNEQLAEQVNNVLASQLGLTSSITDLAMRINVPHLDQFNSLNVALSGLTDSFYKDITARKSWEDLTTVEEVHTAVVDASDEILSNSGHVTLEDLEKFKTEVFEKLSKLLEKSKSRQNWEFIKDFMFLVGFLLTIWTNAERELGMSNEELSEILEHHQNETQKTIKKEGEATRKALENCKKQILDAINEKVELRYNLRYASSDVNLKYSCHKRSQVIGVVKKGQDVTVIEIRHKWILISYIDQETGEPKSGYVLKKYFN